MNWPIGWTSLEPLRKDYFDDWQRRTQGGTAGVLDGNVRCMWWNNDPSETPYRPEPYEQSAGEHTDSMPELPQELSRSGGRLGARQSANGNVRDMRDDVSAEAQQTIQTMRQPNMLEGEGEIIGRVALGIVNRVDRLTALGNGQVPAVVRAAWLLMYQ